MFLFQSGVWGNALCGVWQNTQILSSLIAFTVPGPDFERLCLVSVIPAIAADEDTDRARAMQRSGAMM
jgi:hypothetical protein